MKRALAAVMLLAARPAGAEEPADLTLKNLALGLQQVQVAAQIYATEMSQRLAAKDARIAEWEAYFKAYVGEPAVAAK